MLFDMEDEDEQLEPELETFLLLAEADKPKEKGEEGSNIDENTNYTRLVNEVMNTEGLPSANLNFDEIKPADRATFLLNYLYMQIQAEQLLVDNLQNGGNEYLNVFKECFLVCLKPYLSILNDWITKGEDDMSTQVF